MKRDELQRLLADAVELAETVPDVYRPAAFLVAARVLVLDRPDRVEEFEQPSVMSSTDGASWTVNELLANFRDRSHTDKFEAAIFHALTQEGIESLSSDQILAAYSAARMARPTNPSDIVAKCARRGHVVDGPRRDGQKTWRLTGTGQRYIEALVQELAGGGE